MTTEQEIYYAIKESIQVMEHYDTGEDFALVSSLRRMRELEQKLQHVCGVDGACYRRISGQDFCTQPSEGGIIFSNLITELTSKSTEL